MDSETLADCKADLKQDSTLNEMFDTLDDHYDLDQKIGIMAKTNFINQLQRLLKMTATKPR